jgi:hypothetical protein
MSASDAAPLPRAGEVFFDVRGNSRCMRLSWYADTGVAVFSIWQGPTCTGTFRLPIGELDRMVDTLRRGPQRAEPADRAGRRDRYQGEPQPPGHDRRYGQDYPEPRDHPGEGFPPNRGYGPDWPDPSQPGHPGGEPGRGGWEPAPGWQPTVSASAADLGLPRGHEPARDLTRDLGSGQDLGQGRDAGQTRDLVRGDDPGLGYQGWTAAPDRDPGGYPANLGREPKAAHDADRFAPPYATRPADPAPGDYFSRPGQDRGGQDRGGPGQDWGVPGRDQGGPAWEQDGTVSFPQSPSGRMIDTDSGQYRLGEAAPRTRAAQDSPARGGPDYGRIARDQFERDRFGAPYDRHDRADLLPPDFRPPPADQPLENRDTMAEPDYRGSYQSRDPRLPRHGRGSES